MPHLAEDWDDDDWGSDYDYDCDHQDAELDIVIGELQCHCGYRRAMTSGEISAECQRMAEYQEAMEREQRWARWYTVTAWLRGLIPMRWRTIGRYRKLLISDDEIPF
jgi:hypothetical protein